LVKIDHNAEMWNNTDLHVQEGTLTVEVKVPNILGKLVYA